MVRLNLATAIVDRVKPEKSILQIDDTDNKNDLNLLDRDKYFLFDLLNNYIQGILILSDKGDIVYVNNTGQNVLEKMDEVQADCSCLPREICYLFQFQSDICHHFPDQSWSLTATISTNEHNFFDIQTRWIRVRSSDSDCLLFIMEDSNQRINEIVMKEACRYGLTPRETEVWVLHKSHYTYKQIATKLNIMPNTVKKHMKNILIKQRLASEKEKTD